MPAQISAASAGSASAATVATAPGTPSRRREPNQSASPVAMNAIAESAPTQARATALSKPQLSQ